MADGYPVVHTVSRSADHTFSKGSAEVIELVVGLGVNGDAHNGHTVQHRPHARKDPTRPNLRQVHLIHNELHDELQASGFDVLPGQMGENITTRGIDLMALPRGTRLRFGEQAEIEVTGLRNPCQQLNDFRPGLMNALVYRDDNGKLVRKAGIMSIVVAAGAVRPGDRITVSLPAEPHEALDRV